MSQCTHILFQIAILGVYGKSKDIHKSLAYVDIHKMWHSFGFAINKRLVWIITNGDKSTKSNEDRRMHI
jgi:hypothetical protein